MLIAVMTVLGQRRMIDEHDISDVFEIAGDMDPETQRPKVLTAITRYSVQGQLVVQDSLDAVRRQYTAEGEAMRATLRQLTDALALVAKSEATT